MIKTSASRKVFMVLNYAIMIVICLSCVLPFVHLLAVSLSGTTAVAAGKVVFLPVDFNLYSYEFAFRGGQFVRSLMNSIVVVILGTLVNLVLMILTAYPLSKNKDMLLGRDIYLVFFVITMLISGGTIPTYLVVTRLGLKDTIWSLVLPGALPVYNMIILMNFIKSLPAELQEAARLDGATELQLLYKVVVPLIKPSLATVALFSIVGHWNNWFAGVIYLNDTVKYPLATYLQTLLRNFELILRTRTGTDYTLILTMMNAETGRAAQMFLAAAPVMIVYPFLQKYFTTGLTLGSVKG